MKLTPQRTVLFALLLAATSGSLSACGLSSAKGDDAGTSDGGGGGGGGDDAGQGSDTGTGPEDASSDGGLSVNAKFRAIAAGRRNSCAIYNDGRLFCFGGNDSGQLGDGTTADRGGEPGTMATLKPVDLGPSADVKQVVLGDSHLCALLSTGQVKCWGSNEQGQLGLEDNVDRGDKPGQMGTALPEVKLGAGRTVTKLAAGTDFTCALLDNKTVKCWGRNANGQLGLGSNAVFVGRAPGEMGDALASVDVGPGRTVKDIGAGEMHVCAHLDDDSVKCWGNNQEGQLGVGDATARGRKVSDMGAALSAVDFGTGRKAKELFVGFSQNCARLDDQTLKCFGNNNAGQLGIGSKVSYGDKAGSMGDNLPKANLGTGRTVVSMSFGEGFSCAKLDDGKLKCFGENASGQLCVGDKNDRGFEAASIGDNLPYADLGTGRSLDFFAAGPEHVCGVFSDKTVRCWGANVAGQLGVGDRNPRGDAPGEIGTGLTAAELP